ncbi:MAG: M20/M25/M40 family metallo-hydrolase [Spirochaetaceae bacterium]|nr:M20/M25/M40 family metallo-hydrolase [Spirochaetaceae bacterium]
MILFLTLLLIIVLILIIISIRTLTIQRKFKKQANSVTKEQSNKYINYDSEEPINILTGAIKYKTISYKDPSLTDWKEFDKFHDYLKESFPLTFEKLSYPCDSPNNLIFKFEGQDKSVKPLLLIAHQDVVPANEAGWDTPPFEGIKKDGYLYGRGSFDVKILVISILQSFEELLRKNEKPARTVFSAFGCDEESSGDNGATKISEQFEKEGINFEMVLDEGGAVAEDYIKGIDKPITAIGIAEKGYLDLKLTRVKNGGHSSTPNFPTAMGEIASAIEKIEKNQMKPRITKPIKDLIHNLGLSAPFGMGVLFLNQGLTSPIIKKAFSGGQTTSALIRTTITPTMMSGSNAANIIAKESWALLNCRVLPGDSDEVIIKYIKKIINNDNIKITVVNYKEPSPISTINTEAWNTLKNTIKRTFPDSITTSFLMMGGTDAKHYHNVCDNIYRFEPCQMNQSEIAKMHNDNERMSFDNIHNATKFYLDLITTF